MSRQKNVIFHRVPEKRSDKVEERRENDLVFVTDLLDGVFNIKLSDVQIGALVSRQRSSSSCHIQGFGTQRGCHVEYQKTQKSNR